MLNEVNELIETELKDVNDQTTFEEITLNYYAKLLVAYKVYDIPTRTIYNSYPNYIQNSILLSLEEEEEQQQQNQNQNQNQQQQQSSQQQSNNILSEESANKFRYANVNSNNDEFQATA